MSKKDKKMREWCLNVDNLRKMYDRTRKDMDEMYDRNKESTAHVTGTQKKFVTCRCLSLGLWGSFREPDRYNPSAEELYKVLFPELEIPVFEEKE